MIFKGDVDDAHMRPGFQRVMLLRRAAAVQRSHTCRMLIGHTLASHSHGVLMIVFELYRQKDALPSNAMLLAAAVHDLSEIHTGDMPATVKWNNPELKKKLNEISTAWEHENGIRIELTDEESKCLKWCDMFEFAVTCFEEIAMGNRFALEYLTNALNSLDNMGLPYVLGDTTPAHVLFSTFRNDARYL